MKRIDLVGQRFGRLTVLSFAHGKGGAHFNCVCDCGNQKVMRTDVLRKGRGKSCGCLNKELVAERGRKQTKEKASNWKGGRVIQAGYVYIYRPDHPRATNSKYVFEHIIIMENMLGRYLKKGEVVHHCNGDKADNRPYNLRLFSNNGEHTKYHASLREFNDGY